MNKETFLKELREYLKILEDREQEDILAEYAQHIDMKMLKGLSEEEAIRDFGSMEELAAEILEAYHVKPEFGRKNTPTLVPKIKGAVEGGGKFLCRMGRFMKEKFLAVIRSIGHGFRWLGRKGCVFVSWLAKPFKKKKDRKALTEETGGRLCLPEGTDAAEAAADLQSSETIYAGESTDKVLSSEAAHKTIRKGTKDMAAHANGFLRTIGHGIAAIWRTILNVCIWGLKLIWNCGWLLFSLMTAFMTMITLLGFGIVVIFLFQGYPFNGILLMSLGGILCFGALTCAAFSLIIRKQKEENRNVKVKKDEDNEDKTGREEKTEGSGEEVQYE